MIFNDTCMYVRMHIHNFDVDFTFIWNKAHMVMLFKILLKYVPWGEAANSATALLPLVKPLLWFAFLDTDCSGSLPEFPLNW